MDWRSGFLDATLVPMALLVQFGYHLWLFRKIRAEPQTTIIGTNTLFMHQWVTSIMKDNDRKNILAVQSLRNIIMGSTLMASTSMILSAGLAAIVSSNYCIKQPLSNVPYGAHGQFVMALKYVVILCVFMFSFFFYAISIAYVNQVNVLINAPLDNLTPNYVCVLFKRATSINIIGNRIFFAGISLLFWIFSPFTVLLSSISMVIVLYNVDMGLIPPKNITSLEARGAT